MVKNKKMPTILIAEDDQSYIKLFKDRLKKDGFNIISSQDGKETMKILKSKKPDLLVLDIIMPVMDGYEVLEEIHKDKKLKNLKILVLTNLGTNGEVIKKVKEMGALGCFVKSNISIDEMVKQIKHFVL